ncbi:MAG: hypothetical protein J6D47_18210 [Peptostreptococcaceae bacterium]|nr:hypothetical protein [Peptostreptococcaceae bacterium]
MIDQLTKEDLKKLQEIFTDSQIEMILERYSIDQIRKAIDHPAMKK